MKKISKKSQEKPTVSHYPQASTSRLESGSVQKSLRSSSKLKKVNKLLATGIVATCLSVAIIVGLSLHGSIHRAGFDKGQEPNAQTSQLDSSRGGKLTKVAKLSKSKIASSKKLVGKHKMLAKTNSPQTKKVTKLSNDGKHKNKTKKMLAKTSKHKSQLKSRDDHGKTLASKGR